MEEIKTKGTEKKVEVKNTETSKVVAKKESNKIFYGDGSLVTPVGYLDYNDFCTKTKRDQDLPGFDPQFRDFVDYVLKITHQIWEEKGIGVIYDTYHNNITSIWDPQTLWELRT